MQTRSAQFKRVQAARTHLLLSEPFFGVLALRLAIVEDPTCDIAWTNGQAIGFSPAFVDTLSQDELIAVVAHEVMHCACGHPWRRADRDKTKWNTAADYAINGIIKSAGFRLPDCALLDAQYDGKSAEWIYDRLPQGDDGGNGPGNGNDPSNLGEVRDSPTGDDGTDSDGNGPLSESDWQQAEREAEKIAQGQGRMPGHLRKLLANVVKSETDWRSPLRKYLQEVCKADYTWSRPSTRYLPSGLFLPSLHSVRCGRIAIAIDTSGSIDDVLYRQFTSECASIISELQPTDVDVYHCDAHVHGYDTFGDGDVPTFVNNGGGGGTNFCPVFDAIDTSGDTPVVLVYLTDLHGLFPAAEPDYPVIWAVTGSARHNTFGDVIPLD